MNKNEILNKEQRIDFFSFGEVSLGKNPVSLIKSKFVFWGGVIGNTGDFGSPILGSIPSPRVFAFEYFLFL